MLTCLNDFGEGFARELSPHDFQVEEGAMRLIEDFTLDVFTLIRRRTYGDFASAVRFIELQGVQIRYLAPAALIELKSQSSREKDQLDAAILRRILRGEESPKSVDLSQLTPRERAPDEDSP